MFLSYYRCCQEIDSSTTFVCVCLYKICQFLLLARSPDDPQRIRVASVFELFLVLCSLFFVGKFSNSSPHPPLNKILFYKIKTSLCKEGRWGRYLSDCQYRQTNKPTIHARIVVHCACLLPIVLVMVNCSFSLIQRINKVFLNVARL